MVPEHHPLRVRVPGLALNTCRDRVEPARRTSAASLPRIVDRTSPAPGSPSAWAISTSTSARTSATSRCSLLGGAASSNVSPEAVIRRRARLRPAFGQDVPGPGSTRRLTDTPRRHRR